VISVVIPALNEAVNITAAIESAFAGGASEVIVVDGGSSDDTIAVAESAGAKALKAEPHRARQMNAGAELATGDVLLFLHADTKLPAEFGSYVERAAFSRRVAGGAFSLKIDGGGAKYRIVEAIVAFRSKWNSLPYGDQAVFVRANTFADEGGFANMAIMEDYEFVRRLKRRGRIVILPLRVNTSARRWQKLGVVRTAVLNFFIIVAYRVGVAPDRLASWYRNRPQLVATRPLPIDLLPKD
jgi:uncharacterized protein